MIAFSGVRSSWLMLARNSLFARVAASACCWVTRSRRPASLSSCVRACSVCDLLSAAVRSAISCISAAAQARHDQEDVLEDDPRGVLEPAPLAGDEHAVDRLRPEDAAQQVIERDDDRRRDEHAPVAVEREKGQRAEHVEMRLDAAARQMDEQRAHQHLRDGDRVARRRLARAEAGRAAPGTGRSRRRGTSRPRHGRACGCRAVPRQRRYPQREDDAGDPLQHHQAGEQPIGAPVDVVLVLREELARSTRRDGSGAVGRRISPGEERAAEDVGGVAVGAPPVSRSMSAASPAFSPPWPREPVMPPLKISAAAARRRAASAPRSRRRSGGPRRRRRRAAR